MNFINAKFKSKCAETGATIAKGENCLYDRVNKKVYCRSSKKFQVEQETEKSALLLRHRKTPILIIFAKQIIFNLTRKVRHTGKTV